MKITMTAYVYDFALSQLKRGEITNEALAPHLRLTTSKLSESHIKVGEVEIDFEVLPEDQIVEGMIVALRAQAATIRAEATAKCTAIEGKVQQLLSIENNPSKGN
jgi:phosphatidate phosphatase PAH1